MPGAAVIAGRADPPVADWAGRWVNVEDVQQACGDDRDWFTYEMRLQAHQDAWARYFHAAKRKRNRSSKFKFAQIMIIGDMGAQKSTMACWESYKWYQRGHPVFHNGPFLFGRYVAGSGIYDIVDHVPRNSVVAIDEAHTGLESGMAMSSGVRNFAILCAGLRKKNCRLILMSAMASMVSRRVRDMCSEVWKPTMPHIDTGDFGYSVRYPGHSDPKHFIFVWDIWRNFPFRGEDLTSPKHHRRGFGPPDDTRMAMGECVRNAYLLTDSFQPVESAVAQQFASKEAMQKHRQQQASGLSDEHRQLIGWFFNRCREPNPPEYINSHVPALQLGINPSAIGRLMSGLFGDVDGYKHPSKGYHVATIEEAIADKFAISQ